MEVQIDNLTLNMFIGQTLERHHKRLIAGILSDVEAFTGSKDHRRSQMVKDQANFSKRVMFTKLTGLEVESSHASSSGRIPNEEQASAD
jgi:hypothetical protein